MIQNCVAIRPSEASENFENLCKIPTLKYRIIDSHGIKDAVWKFTPIPKRCTWNNRCTWPVGKLTTKDALAWIKDAHDQLVNQQ